MVRLSSNGTVSRALSRDFLRTLSSPGVRPGRCASRAATSASKTQSPRAARGPKTPFSLGRGAFQPARNGKPSAPASRSSEAVSISMGLRPVGQFLVAVYGGEV